MPKTIFISGATSGIGKACAEKFAKAGWNIIITGRREDRLISLKQSLETLYGVKVHHLRFDVQSKIEVFSAVEKISEDFGTIDVLINNAGLALGKDNFADADLQDWDCMLQTNVHGLLYVSRALLPYLKKSSSPHIINIGSTAAKELYEGGSVYCASKFAVDAISKGMRIDLLKDNIKVTCVNPGAVETEFSLVRFKWQKETADAVYKGFTPLVAEDVADVVFYAANLPKHVCINDLVVTTTQQANSIYFNKNS